MAQVGQKSETWKQKRANMRTSVSEHACARARVGACVCERVRGGGYSERMRQRIASVPTTQSGGDNGASRGDEGG